MHFPHQPQPPAAQSVIPRIGRSGQPSSLYPVLSSPLRLGIRGRSAKAASILPTAAKFMPTDSEAKIRTSGAASLKVGNRILYIGTQQVSRTNQNPLVVAFDRNTRKRLWSRTDYEVTGADGRGYGLFFGHNKLYALFSIDGTQGTPNQDFRRVSQFATQSWLKSYGNGGGAKVTVVAQIDPTTGKLLRAAYLSSVLSSGNSNSLSVTGASFNATGNVVLKANAYFSPRRPNGSPMQQVVAGNSPFQQTLVLTSELKKVIKTSAVGWQ